MGYPTYYVEAGDTIPHLFGSYDGGDGSSITLTGLAVTDIEIYKDGGTTTRSSDSGYALLGTDGIDEFGTGIHGFSIDISDNTDAGFFAVGSWYHVVIASVTIDAQTVNFVACAFRIVSATRGLAGTALPDAAADAAGGLPISDGGGLDLDTKLANANEITVARMGALTDWIDGGRLDLLLDAIPTTAMRGTDSAALASSWTAALATALGNYNATRAGYLDELAAANIPADVFAIKAITDLLTLAAINAEVVDVINTDTSGEPAQGAPAATASLRTKIDWLYKVLRNKKTQTATEWDLYDDAGSTVDSKSTISDDATTATFGEIVGGP